MKTGGVWIRVETEAIRMIQMRWQWLEPGCLLAIEAEEVVGF